MHANIALNEELSVSIFPELRPRGQANLLIVTTINVDHLAFSLVEELGEAVSINPILFGTGRLVDIVIPSIIICGLVNISAFKVVDGHVEIKDQTNCPAA